MPQLYNIDSGLMIDAGHTFEEYQSRPEWDALIMAVVESGQEFEEARVPKRQIWFYFPNLNLFFLNERTEHSIMKAAKYYLGESRWEEIEETLESLGSFHDDLDRLDIKKVRRKLKKAREQGLITVTELKNIKDIVSHINGEVIL